MKSKTPDKDSFLVVNKGLQLVLVAQRLWTNRGDGLIHWLISKLAFLTLPICILLSARQSR